MVSQVTETSFSASRETLGSADYVTGLHYYMWVPTGIVLQQSFITTRNGCIFVYYDKKRMYTRQFMT
jgi:hypothetical protein